MRASQNPTDCSIVELRSRAKGRRFAGCYSEVEKLLQEKHHDENTAQNGFVLMVMGINKAGHDYHARSVDDQAGCIEVASDGKDLLSADEHVTGFEVADPRVQTQYYTAPQQNAAIGVSFYTCQLIQCRASPGGCNIIDDDSPPHR